jgi:hypothetical protein
MENWGEHIYASMFLKVSVIHEGDCKKQVNYNHKILTIIFGE